MQVEVLETERLRLVKVDQSVLDMVFVEMNGAEQMKFLGCDTPEQLIEKQRQYDEGFSTYNKKFLYFFLIDKITEMNIGWCGYHTWYTPHRRAEIGYQIAEEYQNRGLMKEALIPIIDYGLNKMNLQRIEAYVGEENTASLRLMEIFEFKKEGLMKKHYNIDGVNVDSLVFGLLK